MSLREINQVFEKGFITMQPELKQKQTKSGVVNYCRFRIGVNHWNSKTQESKANFLNVVAFGSDAKWLSEKQKGQEVYVQGKLQTSNWTDNQGNKRENVEIIAFDVIPVERTVTATDNATIGNTTFDEHKQSQKEEQTESQKIDSSQNYRNNSFEHNQEETIDDPFAANSEAPLDVDLDESKIPF